MANSPREALEERRHHRSDDDAVDYRDLHMILDPIYDALEALMADEQDLETAQAAEATAVATLSADEVTAVGDLQSEIKTLQEQAANGSPVTAEQLNSAVEKSTALAASVGAVDAALKAAEPTSAPENTEVPSTE